MKAMIKQGDTVHIKPEWQDRGDSEYTWEAVEDQDGDRVLICPVDSPLHIKPHYAVQTYMLETAHYTE